MQGRASKLIPHIDTHVKMLTENSTHNYVAIECGIVQRSAPKFVKNVDRESFRIVLFHGPEDLGHHASIMDADRDHVNGSKAVFTMMGRQVELARGDDCAGKF